jgi:N4-gp56 family major capsid protein
LGLILRANKQKEAIDMSWTFDAPSGTYRNHALSSDIRRVAIADVQFMKFFRAEPGYGKGKGESVTITRMLNLPLAGRVGELEKLPSGRPAISTKTVGVSEWGYKVPMTDFEKSLTFYNIMDPIQSSLRDQISLTMDKMCADALKLTPIKYTPTTSGGSFSTNGSAGATATRNLGVQDLRRISDELSAQLKCPRFKNGKYVGILSTRAARGIKNDPEYKDWLAPSTSDPLITGRLKDIENFALYETNHFDALEDLVGSSTTTGEAIFFGADAGGLVRIADPELRAGIPYDLGRYRDVGWVGTLEAFLVWEQASYAHAIHVTSQ